MDYESMTVAELKEILKARGLKVSGKKAELIQRLSENCLLYTSPSPRDFG